SNNGGVSQVDMSQYTEDIQFAVDEMREALVHIHQAVDSEYDSHAKKVRSRSDSLSNVEKQDSKEKKVLKTISKLAKKVEDRYGGHAVASVMQRLYQTVEQLKSEAPIFYVDISEIRENAMPGAKKEVGRAENIFNEKVKGFKKKQIEVIGFLEENMEKLGDIPEVNAKEVWAVVKAASVGGDMAEKYAKKGVDDMLLILGELDLKGDVEVIDLINSVKDKLISLRSKVEAVTNPRREWE
ncbi:unnamed protein product, partial [marine sediment metagenome]